MTKKNYEVSERVSAWSFTITVRMCGVLTIRSTLSFSAYSESSLLNAGSCADAHGSELLCSLHDEIRTELLVRLVICRSEDGSHFVCDSSIAPKN